MLQSRHIVVADFPEGKTETLYQGASVVDAEKALQAAIDEGKAEAVVIFHHPIASRVRYPVAEKVAAAERARQAEEAKNAEGLRKQQLAQEKIEEAKRLTAEAKQLKKEAADHLEEAK